jgi:general secretion pathway protein L
VSDWIIWCAPDGSLRRRRAGAAGDEDDAATGTGVDGTAVAGDAAAATARRADGPRATLLLPAERVLCARVSVPARTRRQLAAALPFAVEERLACDLDAVHIATGAMTPGSPVTVRVVDRGLLEQTLAAAAASGIEVERVEVDAERLPLEAGVDAVGLLTAERALLRTASHTLAVPRAQLAVVLPMLVAEAKAGTDGSEGEAVPAGDAGAGGPPRHRCLLLHDAAVPPTAAERAALHAAHLDYEERAVDAFALLAAGPADAVAAGAGRIDLLQGPYARQAGGSFDARPWRLAAGLAAAWFVVAVAADVARGSWLSLHAEETRTRAEALYREWFPGETRIADLRRQVMGRLGDAGGGGGAPALELLGVLAAAARAQQDVEVESVTYHGERGELAVQLLAPDIARIDSLRDALLASGVDASVGSVEQDAARVRGRVRIGGSGS